MVVPEDGMDKALGRARQLFTAVDNAVRQGGLPRNEERALSDIRDQILLLECKVREARLEADEERKADLINGVDPLRRRVIAKCHEHQAKVHTHHALVQEVLDWCELKEAPAPCTPMHRNSAEDALSTDAIISTPLSTTPDISSGWVQSHARRPFSSKTFDSNSLSQADWETKQSLQAVKTSSGGASNNSLTVNTGSSSRSPTKIRSPTRRRALQQQQMLASSHRSSVVDQQSKINDQSLSASQSPTIIAVAAAAGNPSASQQAAIQQVLDKIKDAREGAAKLGLQRRSAAGSAEGAELEQQGQEQAEQQHQPQAVQQQSWKRRPAGFLHLDRADMSLTSSGYSSNASHAEQEDSVLIGVPRRYDNPLADEESFVDPVGGSHGWEMHQTLRQQPAAMRASLRTSADVLGALRSSNVREAAILSSNASRVHILHDAVAQKPKDEDGLVHVPVVPPSLARRKKQRWWVRLIKALAGTTGTAAVLAAVAVAAREVLLEMDRQAQANDRAQPGKQQQQVAATKPQQQQKVQNKADAQQKEQQQKRPAAMPKLRYAPVGPAPDASAGCG